MRASLIKQLVPLEGGRNFRDLGGYPTADGRRVRSSRVYRSGVMSYLTAADHSHLERIDIRVLCDFRTLRERTLEPIHWSSANVVRLQWDYDARHTGLRELLQLRDFSAEMAHASMVRLYRRMPGDLAEPFGALFQRLAAGELPLVFGCAAGKDRTGVAAALVLTSLGVPWDQVLADYTLTDEVLDLEQQFFANPDKSIGLGAEYAHLARVDSGARAPLLKALPEYLQAAFAQIVADHGSITGYLQGCLGVPERSLQAMQFHLLE